MKIISHQSCIHPHSTPDEDVPCWKTTTPLFSSASQTSPTPSPPPPTPLTHPLPTPAHGPALMFLPRSWTKSHIPAVHWFCWFLVWWRRRVAICCSNLIVRWCFCWLCGGMGLERCWDRLDKEGSTFDVIFGFDGTVGLVIEVLFSGLFDAALNLSIPDLNEGFVLAGCQSVHLQVHVIFVLVLLSLHVLRYCFIFIPSKVLAFWLVTSFLILARLLNRERVHFDIRIRVT